MSNKKIGVIGILTIIILVSVLSYIAYTHSPSYGNNAIKGTEVDNNSKKGYVIFQQIQRGFKH